MAREILESYIVESPEQAVVLLNPLRSAILMNIIEPASSAEIARNINETPQRVNYHLKALEKVGLARKVGTRQVRNLVEVLYQAVARSFVLSESLGWSTDIVKRIKDQGSLSHMIAACERIRKDVLLLMEKSDSNETIPSATLDMKIYLETEEKRKQFVEEYVELMKQLAEKYQSSQTKTGAYNIVLAVYPEPSQGGEKDER